MKHYPEIEILNQLLQRHSINILVPGKYPDIGESFKSISLHLNTQLFELYVEDEYNDLRPNNQALCLCLLFLEMEDYKAEDDFLTWCQAKGLNASNGGLRNYYMQLGSIYSLIKSIIGTTESPISSFDFEMNIGAAQKLRSQ